MTGFKCEKCSGRATHYTPLSGTGPLNAYRCKKHRGPSYSPIPGVKQPGRGRSSGKQNTHR
jgi:hypothetical protein